MNWQSITASLGLSLILAMPALASTEDETLELLAAPIHRVSREGEGVDITLATPIITADVTFRAWDLPPGLVLDAASGRVSGTPGTRAAGWYQVTVTAQSRLRSERVTFSWSVIDGTLPVVESPGIQVNRSGDIVDLLITATDADGDPLKLTAYSLPRGLALDPATRHVTGTVADHTGQASYLVSIMASDGNVTGGTAFTWVILGRD